jgi:hypothetical protein
MEGWGGWRYGVYICCPLKEQILLASLDTAIPVILLREQRITAPHRKKEMVT